MKVPEKIFVVKLPNGILHAVDHPDTLFGKPYPDYIRKDAIIKLLCDRKDNMHILRTVYSKARRDEDAELIDIINSL